MTAVGCVPYVNAIPLIAQFAALGENSPLQVLVDVPSALPRMLDDGRAAAVLCSSFEALATPGRRVAEGVAIASRGAVESVRLFSRVPFAKIRRLALDKSSLTSNRLAQIVLAEAYGAHPEVEAAAPDLATMLAHADAAVLIGDSGMLASAEGLHVLDLGQAWRDLTGQPFVWAMWIGDEGLTPQVAGWLQAARAWGEERLADLARNVPWPPGMAARYLARTMEYRLEEDMLAGLRAFGAKLVEHGHLDAWHEPTWVTESAMAVRP